ncbi:hypothetical protein [Kaistia sp. MMO-174]|uniref:hypothetical protein n=1 Tax=Kaistia sp. MMO-174 TaxID=3081256 RepID=UPI00301AA8D9
MITLKRLTQPPRRPWLTLRRRRPQVFAVFSYRFDAHLVPDLLANIEPIVDGWVAFDDRAATGVFSSEAGRRRILLQEARKAGADWILAVDPDERFEAGVRSRIRRLMAESGRVAWGFRFREMYTPTTYRIDGIWGKKIRYCLFTMFDPAERTDTGLHDLWFPRDGGFQTRHCDLDLYHLKMIAPARRLARRDLYNFLDPNRADQPIGYDYLAEERDAAFETIPRNRLYHPAHVDDGGLWMQDLGSLRKHPIGE